MNLRAANFSGREHVGGLQYGGGYGGTGKNNRAAFVIAGEKFAPQLQQSVSGRGSRVDKENRPFAFAFFRPPRIGNVLAQKIVSVRSGNEFNFAAQFANKIEQSNRTDADRKSGPADGNGIKILNARIFK